MTRVLALTVLAALVSCGGSSRHGLVTVNIDVEGTPLFGVHHLTVRVADETRSPARVATPFDVAVPLGSIPPGITVPLLFTDVEGNIEVSVEAVDANGLRLASAAVQTTVRIQQSLYVPLKLPGGKTPCPTEPPNVNRYVANQLVLPTQQTDFAFDLNGDGQLDNRYGTTIGALTSLFSSPQSVVDQDVASGKGLFLVAARAVDPAFEKDTCATATVQAALVTPTPDFSGNGLFFVDSALAAASFTGQLGGGTITDFTPSGTTRIKKMFSTGVFISSSPVLTTSPVTLFVHLPFTDGAPIALHGARITFLRTGPTLIGQVNGAIATTDMQTVLIPSVARRLDALASKTSCDSSCMQVRSLFDNGGQSSGSCPNGDGSFACQNNDGSCAKKDDQHIATCELATSGVAQNLFEPDVQLFDAQGHYHPSAANTTPDSFSVGFGFQAVGARF